MKICEVETQVGITKKNIRFYEEQGLLSPRRNSENGYRDYGEEDVEALRRIKLMRKLGVPLGDIRRMQEGGTVADGMRRHLVTLEREKRNTEQAIDLCRSLTDQELPLDRLDAAALLEEMERMEAQGTAFQDKQRGDSKKIRYAGAAAAAGILMLLFLGLMAVVICAYIYDPEDAPPLGILLILLVLFGVMILTTLLALRQRIREIRKGEIDDAKNY